MPASSCNLAVLILNPKNLQSAVARTKRFMSRKRVFGDTMNKQRSRAWLSEPCERSLIGILIAVASERSAPGVFARGLKRLQHQSRLGSPFLPSAPRLALPRRAFKHNETPFALRETPFSCRAVWYSKALSTRSNTRMLRIRST